MNRSRGHVQQGVAGLIEPSLAAIVLEALPDATAVVDGDGVVVAVNEAWRRFARENGGSAAATGPGVSYLDVCARSLQHGCPEAGAVAAGLRAVLAQERTAAEVVEYPCAAPSIARWFMVRINRLTAAEAGAVISHVDITHRKLAEEALAHAASHDPLSGLANRRLLGRRLGTALARPAGQAPPGSGCSTSTSTGSRPSTTRSVTPPATRCC